MSMKKSLIACAFFIAYSISTLAQSNWLDTTFAGKGIFSQDSMFTTTMIIQEDGKILMGGDYYRNYDNLALTRLNPDGSLDSSFGKNGYVLPINQNFTDIHSFWAWICGLVQQKDGKIVAAGIAGNEDAFQDYYPTKTCLARYKINGSIDSSFGTNGFIADVFDSVWGAVSCNVMIDSSGRVFLTNLDDGQISFVGNNYSNYRPYSAYRTYCYDTSGHLDTTFGIGGGIYITSDLVPFIFSSCIQPDQKILYCGADSTKSVFSLIRYNASGTLDSSFGINGVAGISCDPNELGAFNSICVQSDGKILVSKYLFANDSGYFKVSRFTNTGNIDNTFGQSGCVEILTPIPRIHNVNNDVSFVAQYPNGNILVGASAVSDTIFRSKGFFAFARYLPDGIIDSTFGINGVLDDTIVYGYGGSYLPVIMGLSILSDNKFIASSGNQANRYLEVAMNTSIKTIDASSFSIYPDPAGDHLYISGLPPSATLCIIDMTGRICYTPSSLREIDVSALPSGVYLLRIQDSSAYVVKKFVKE